MEKGMFETDFKNWPFQQVEKERGKKNKQTINKGHEEKQLELLEDQVHAFWVSKWMSGVEV